MKEKVAVVFLVLVVVSVNSGLGQFVQNVRDKQIVKKNLVISVSKTSGGKTLHFKKFNKNGSIVEAIYYPPTSFPNSEKGERYAFVYNDEEQITKSYQYRYSDTITSSYGYLYDDKDNLVSKTELWDNGKVKSLEEYKYDSANFVVKKVRSSTGLHRRFIYEYDVHGQLVTSYIYNYSGGDWFRRIDYSYDSNGNMISEKITNAKGGGWKSEYRCNSEGLLVSEHWLNKHGVIDVSFEYTYEFAQ